MSIGRIVVDLLARTGSFETDLNRSAKLAEKRAKEIDANISKAGVAVGAALGVAGAAAVAFGMDMINGLDALNDVADATGASIEKISALENVAMLTGTSMDTVSAAMTKFNATLKEVDGKNGPSMALKAIGLDAKELKSIDPAESLRRTAVALSGFADDGNKARLVQELFGKSVKEVAPFLKDLAEQTELVGTVSAKQASNAEKFNKELFLMRTNAAQAGRAIASDLLPALNRFMQNARDINKLGGFGLIVKDAAKDMFGLGKMTGDNGADIKQFMRERERLLKDLDFANRKGLGSRGIEQDLAENARYLAILRAKQANAVLMDSVGEDYGDAVSRKFLRPPSVDFNGADNGKKGSAPKESEYQRYLENLQKELDKTEDLTKAGMALADVQSGRLKLAKGESLDHLLAIARQVDAAKALTDETKRGIEFEAQLREARLKAAEGMEKEAITLREGNQSLRDEIELIGANAEAQALIEKARISSTIAVKEQELAHLSSANSLTRESAALEEQIRLLKERVDLVGMKGARQQLADDMKKTEELANSVGAAFSSSFEQAAIEGKKLSDVLKGLAKDILSLTLRQAVTVPMSNSIARALSIGGSGGDELGDLLRRNDYFGTGGGGWGSALRFLGLFGGPRAEGGPVSSGATYLVGERGPELFKPNTTGRILPNEALGGGGRAISYSPNIYVDGTADRAATEMMVRKVSRESVEQFARELQRERRL